MRCKCPDRTKWVVVDRECNYSAFNGYHRTSSVYSKIHCYGCGAWWRTRAAYVDDLDDLDLDAPYWTGVK